MNPTLVKAITLNTSEEIEGQLIVVRHPLLAQKYYVCPNITSISTLNLDTKTVTLGPFFEVIPETIELVE